MPITIEQYKQELIVKKNGLNNSVESINQKIDLIRERSNLLLNICCEQRDWVKMIITSKYDSFVATEQNQLKQFRLVYENTFWDADSSVFQLNHVEYVSYLTSLRGKDIGTTRGVWHIDQRTRATENDPWSEWVLRYNTDNAIAEYPEFHGRLLKFDEVWDMIIHVPGQGGLYGLIEDLRMMLNGKNMINGDINKFTNLVNIL